MPFPYLFPMLDTDEADDTPPNIHDHTARAKDRLAEQFKNQPNLAKVLDSINVQSEATEYGLWQLLTERYMATAVGAQLDVLGAVVGQDRQGFDDDTYRLYLKARILLNVSSGTKEEIYSIFRALIDPSATLEIEEQFPATFVLRLNGMAFSGATISSLVVFLRAAKSAGVRAILEWIEADPVDVFQFDAGPGFDQGHLAGGVE